VRPPSAPQGVGQALGLVGGHPVGRGEADDEIAHLGQRFASGLRQDEGLIVDLAGRLHLHHLEDVGGGEAADLGVDGAQHGVGIHHHLVGRQGQQGAARHGIVGDEDRHLALPVDQGVRDLLGGQHQPPGRVEDEVDGHVGWRQLDGPQDLLGVVDVDVASQRDAQQRHLLLAVDQGDDPAVTAGLQPPDGPDAMCLELTLAPDRREG